MKATSQAYARQFELTLTGAQRSTRQIRDCLVQACTGEKENLLGILRTGFFDCLMSTTPSYLQVQALQ
jgi:hypothetical protein